MCTNKYPPVIHPSSFNLLSGNHQVKNTINPRALPTNLPYANPRVNYGFRDGNSPPNPTLITPAIFGGLAAFGLGFGFFGHCLTGGYSKFIFFVNIYAIIATFGVGYYIYQLTHWEAGDRWFADIILPIIIITLFYATVYNFIYSLYPFTFSGTIGDTRITQFLSFTAKSIGAISVGETFNVTALTTGTQILAAIETLFNFFVITLLISLLVR